MASGMPSQAWAEPAVSLASATSGGGATVSTPA